MPESTKAKRAADRVAVDTVNQGASRTSAVELDGQTNPNAATAPHVLAKTGDTYPVGNPALATQVFLETASQRAANGDDTLLKQIDTKLASENDTGEEARAVRPDTDEEIAEAKQQADAAKQARADRVADALSTIQAAAR